MRTRRLGTEGPEVSVVGLGCNNFGMRVDAEGTRAVVDAALDAGVTLFDTADIYGNKGGSESFLGEVLDGRRDRKSTRLNSSHRCISYAVFCLKKKKKKKHRYDIQQREKYTSVRSTD